mgnify:FL=1
MIVSLIVAMDLQGGIGRDGGIPWHLSTDLKRFKRLTMGHYLVMGRKTHVSIGRALPGRINIVLSRAANYQPQGCLVAASLDGALAQAQDAGAEEVFVIGGGQVYSQALKLADRIYLTRVHTIANCDTFFPDLDAAAWRVVEEQALSAGEEDEYPSTYQVLQRTGT